MRSLSPEEQALWARVASTIRPLSRDDDGERPTEPPPEIRPVSSIAEMRVVQSPRPAQQARKVGTNLDGSWDRRLKGGAVEPDRVLDLHGMNLDGAWRAIDRGLEQAIDRGERVILLITGHQRRGEPPVQRGRIRAAVHDWLSSSRHASKIAAVRGAHGRHGGGGSLYIILRRPPRTVY